MALADTAKLVVDLSLSGNFNQQIKASTKSLQGLGRQITDTQGRAYKAGQQIGTGIKRGVLIAVAAGGALTALFLRMAKEGQNAANVEKIFAQAVSNSGKVSIAQVGALRKQQEALLNLAGVDDELIKTEQTRLVQMGLTGDQILKITPLILDFSKATGVDLLTATKLVGKATQGNTTALSRYGVLIDKAKAKTDPFAASVDALSKKFGGTTQALSGSLNVKLDVLREKLANVREEAGIKLLPVLTRIVDTVAQDLVPAFQTFIDAVLPDVIGGLNKFADFLKSGGAQRTFTKFLDTAKAAAPLIQKSAEATFTIVKAAVDLFASLPPEIQGLAAGAFAINKLTGGLVTNIGGALIDLVGKSRGSSPANPVWVASEGGLFGGKGGGMSNLLATGIAGAIVLAAVPIGQAFAAALPPELKGPGGRGESESQRRIREAREAMGGGGAGLANPILDRGGRESGTPGIFGQITGGLRGIISGIINSVRQMGNAFQQAIGALRKAKTDIDREKAAREITRQVTGGRGSVAGTQSAISALRSALKQTHDPKLAAIIRADLRKVEGKLPGRQFAAQQLHKADALLRDGKITNSEMRQLKGIEKSLKDHGLPHAASVISKRVDAVKHSIDSKNWNPTIKVYPQVIVSLRGIYTSQQQAARIGGGPGSYRP